MEILMLRSVVAAIAVCGLVTAAEAAPRQGGTKAASEARYRACMDSVASDARKALATAEDWVKAGGGDAAQHCAAAAQMALGEYARAADGLQRLAREGGREIAGSPVLRASLLGQAAHAWLAADDPDRAETAASEASALVPTDAGLLVLRARARAGQHRLGDALVDLDRAIALDPKLVDAYVFRASALRQQRALDQAAVDLDKALSLDPQHPEALLERGIVRRLQGNDAGARADWETLTKVAPKTAAAESARLNLEAMDGGK